MSTPETKKRVKVYNRNDTDGKEQEGGKRRKNQRQFSSFSDAIHRERTEELFLEF